jgi:hypothetical protein
MLKTGAGAILVCIVWVVMLSGCQRDKTPANTCTTCPAISFKADIIPIFNQYCATSTACHQGSNSVSANLNLDSTVAYTEATRAGTGYVIDSNANNSILYDQLLYPLNNNHHMPVGLQLDQCDIQKIYCWIQEGAPNN